MTDSHQKGARKKTEGSKKKSIRKQRKGIIERTAKTAESVHRAVVGLPLSLLEHIDGLKRPVARVRKLQDRSITTTYDMLRGVNREVVDLLREARGPEEPKRRKTRTVRHPTPGVETTRPPRAAAATS